MFEREFEGLHPNLKEPLKKRLERIIKTLANGYSVEEPIRIEDAAAQIRTIFDIASDLRKQLKEGN